LPLIDTVISPICPLLAVMKASAFWTWLSPLMTGPASVAAGGP